jgi:hypothetical protein
MNFVGLLFVASLGLVAFSGFAFIDTAIERQARFRAAPDTFEPRPLVYRPILQGMGWGVLLQDISYHFGFAVLLERPFVLVLDQKDPTGQIGSGNPIGLGPVDWRVPAGFIVPSKDDDNATTIQLTCEELRERCGGIHYLGTWDRVIPWLRDQPQVALYSEYTHGLTMPLDNSRQYRAFISKYALRDRPVHESHVHFTFRMLFNISGVHQHNPATEVLAHVRTGHREGGRDRPHSLEIPASCLAAYPNKKWRIISDTMFSLQLFHVGYHPESAGAWIITLRDWATLATAHRGPLFLRNTMATAGSYGLTAAYVAGLKQVHNFTGTVCSDYFQTKWTRDGVTDGGHLPWQSV